MTKTNVFFLLLYLFFLSCGQNTPTQKKADGDSIEINKNDTILTSLSIDTNKIAILPSGKINFFSLKDSVPAKLTNQDIQTIETLLTDCMHAYDAGKDSTKLYSEYIDLKKYKRQYVAYLNSKGEKKVFINCLCNGVGGFEYWKERLVEVDDGGVCFFNVTINVTKKLCGMVLVNGPG
jgi:hypothetical protein